MSKPLAFTSVPRSLQRNFGGSAYGESYQRQCIASWQAAGFDIVSVNSDAEIRDLRASHPQVAFVSNGTEDGRTRISTILQLAHESGHRVAALFNADIFAFSPGRAWNAILEAAVDSVVVFERLNIDATTMRATGQFCCGFDAFVFDTQAIRPMMDDQHWFIGKPFWDYWFPITMYLHGCQIRSLQTPMIAHIEHEQRWSEQEFESGARRLVLQLQSAPGRDLLPAALLARIAAFDGSSPTFKAMEFWNVIVPWLRSAPPTITVVAANQDGDFLIRLLAGMSEPREKEFFSLLEGTTWKQFLTRKIRRAGRILRSRTRT